MRQPAIKTILVDDAPKAIQLLKLMIDELAPGEIEVLDTAQNASEALQKIMTYKPQLVFLDIEMPGQSGVELARQLAELESPCSIVFTTAYNQYAIQAFRLSAVDYLLKPIQENELLEAIQKVKERQEISRGVLKTFAQNLEVENNKVLSIPTGNGYEFVAINDILYLEADGSYVRLYQHDQPAMVISKNLKYFEQALLSTPQFFRAHRTFLINLQHIASYSKSDRGTIIMKDGKHIDLARNRRAEFLNMLPK